MSELPKIEEQSAKSNKTNSRREPMGKRGIPEVVPLEEKAFRPDNPYFNCGLNPVVQVAENATYIMLYCHPDMTTQEEIEETREEIWRVENLPEELVPIMARQKIAEAKRLIKSYGGSVKFSREEKEYLQSKFDLDPPDFYE